MSAPATLAREVALMTNSGRLGMAPYTAVVDRAWCLFWEGKLTASDMKAVGWYEKQAVGTGRVIQSARSLALGIHCSLSTAKRANRHLKAHGIIVRHPRFYANAEGQARQTASLTVLVGATRRVSAAVKRAAAARQEATAAAVGRVRAIVDNPLPAPVQPSPSRGVTGDTPSASDEDLPPQITAPVDKAARFAALKALIQRPPSARDLALEEVRARRRAGPG